jgi:hypothetical protein
MSKLNGHAPGRAAFVGPAATSAYRPGVLGRSWLTYPDDRGPLTLWDIERMRKDPQVSFGLKILFAPLSRVTWKVACADPAAADFADRTFRKAWTQSLPALFKMKSYGWAAGEPLYTEQADGTVAFDRIKDVHPRDATALELDGRVVGCAVRGCGRLVTPRYVWVANEPECGSPYGQSALDIAWGPWAEKSGRHGAREVRKLWFIKNVFRGLLIRHPDGVIQTAEGARSCADYAREVAEQYETGGILTLPNTLASPDGGGGPYEWVVEWAQANGDVPGLAEYVSALDREILVALGIPPEVVDAAASGSGWSGRSVPFLVYLQGRDQDAAAIAAALAECVVRPLVWHNYGERAADSLEISLDSLVPDDAEDEAAKGGGKGAGLAGALAALGGGGGPERMALRAGAAGGDDDKTRDEGPPGDGPGGDGGPGGGAGGGAALAAAAGDAAAPAADSPHDDARDFAAWCASLLNLLRQAGEDDNEEYDRLTDALEGTGWTVGESPRGWRVVREPPVQMAFGGHAHRAPKGGISFNGKQYRGGMFIPAAEVANAPPAEKAKLAEAEAAAKKTGGDRVAARKKRGSVDHGKVAARLAGHASRNPLSDADRRQASAAARALHAHHGELTFHRLEELADSLETALANVGDDHPNADGLRAQFGRRLAQLGAALDHAREKGVTGEVKAPPTRENGTPHEPEHGKAYNVPTGGLKTDPSRFQYKLNTSGEHGVTDEFKQVRTWSPDFAGVISVWRDPETGEDYVVNGHHRYELAGRLGADGLKVQYLQAKDAKEARALGALINIAEGRGTAVDAAKFMRDTGGPRCRGPDPSL